MRSPRTKEDLDSLLSEPDTATRTALADVDGDVIILGAGGKIGPSLACMARRAIADQRRKVIAVSRFSDPYAEAMLASADVVTVRADLSDPATMKELPDAANVLWLAGQKFGTSNDPIGAWTHNVVASVHAAERFSGSRVVCYSTGNVYGRTEVAAGGSLENNDLRADGEYAASCIGRERVFAGIARRTASPLLLYRLFYANDLRYGLVTEIALKVLNGEPVSLDTGYVNVIWQGDANRLALRALGLAAVPAMALNVTGPVVSVREIATLLARHAGMKAHFIGEEGTESLLGNVTALSRYLPHTALPLQTLCQWVITWIQSGGHLLAKPTKFEVRDGHY